VSVGSSGVPADAYVNQATFGLSTPGTGYYNAYATLGRTLRGQSTLPAMLFSHNSGRTWTTFYTVDATYNTPLYIDAIDVHPSIPDLFIAHTLVNASTNLYQPYLGKISSASSNNNLALTPIGIDGAHPVIASWVGWSKSNNASLFVTASASASDAPHNGASLLRVQLTSLTGASLAYHAAVVIADLYDVTQVGDFVLAEVSVSNPIAGFNQTALRVSVAPMTLSPSWHSTQK
jgi:hypothetical protein